MPFRRPNLTHPLAVHTAYDSFGAILMEYSFFAGPQVLYVRWHNHITGDELVRLGDTDLQLNQQWQPRVLLQDMRGVSGEWGADSAEAWVEYEWMPGIQAKCPNLRRIAMLLDPTTSVPYANRQLMTKANQQFDFRVFYSLLSAWRWINEHIPALSAIAQ